MFEKTEIIIIDFVTVVLDGKIKTAHDVDFTNVQKTFKMTQHTN